MSIFQEYDLNGISSKKSGAKIKHNWIREIGVGQAYPIPKDIKISSVRVLVSLYSKESGKKFRVSTNENLVIRVA